MEPEKFRTARVIAKSKRFESRRETGADKMPRGKLKIMSSHGNFKRVEFQEGKIKRTSGAENPKGQIEG